MEEEIDILAIGNPLVDMVAFYDEEYAAFLGLHPNSNIDVSRSRLNEILLALPEASPSSGGGAANVAKLTSMLGYKTAFIGCIGTAPHGQLDRFAGHFMRDMQEAGVSLHLSRSLKPTGVCAVIHMNGRTTAIAADPSAALDLQAKDIDEGLIRRAKLLMLDGFLLAPTTTSGTDTGLIRQDLLTRILSLANYYGTTVALDVSLTRIAGGAAAFIADMAKKYPLILFMNESEATAFNCSLANSCEDAPDRLEEDERYELLRSLCQNGPFPIAVVKQAEKGVLVYASGSKFKVPNLAKIPFDRTGCGDGFSAGFISAWLNNQPIRSCAIMGNYIAREMLSVPGSKVDRERLQKIGKKKLGLGGPN